MGKVNRKRRVLEMYDVTDRALSMLVENARANGEDLACRRGCAACCTYPVALLEDEAIVVAEAVEALREPRKGEVVARLVAWAKLWREHHTDPARISLDVAEWQAMGVACPLLDMQTYDCMIYDQRPLACRAHHAMPVPDGTSHPDCDRCVIRQPPEGCFTTSEEVSHGHRTAVLQLDPDLAAKSQFMLAGTTDLLKLDIGMLPEMVLKAGRRYGWRVPYAASVILNVLPALPSARLPQ